MGGGYTKKEIMDAVVETLRPLSVQGGGYAKQLEARGAGEKASGFLEEALRLPALFVSFSSSSYSPGQYMHLRETVGFEVIVVLMEGAGPDPEAVLADIRGMLCGKTLGLDAGPVMPVRDTPLQAGGHRAAFSALYSVTRNVPLQNT